MQAITLDVIMAGIFGIEGTPKVGSLEHRLRVTTKRMVNFTTKPAGQLIGMLNARSQEPIGIGRALVRMIQKSIESLIAERRRAEDLDGRRALAPRGASDPVGG
jgi:cytochrome P450